MVSGTMEVTKATLVAGSVGVKAQKGVTNAEIYNYETWNYTNPSRWSED